MRGLGGGAAEVTGVTVLTLLSSERERRKSLRTIGRTGGHDSAPHQDETLWVPKVSAGMAASLPEARRAALSISFLKHQFLHFLCTVLSPEASTIMAHSTDSIKICQSNGEGERCPSPLQL